MLVLSRKKDEKIIIGDQITVMVIEIRGDKVRLGIDAPRDVTVHREEVYDAIRREHDEQQNQPLEPDGHMLHGVVDSTSCTAMWRGDGNLPAPAGSSAVGNPVEVSVAARRGTVSCAVPVGEIVLSRSRSDCRTGHRLRNRRFPP